jgi:GDP-L-fucose synthase
MTALITPSDRIFVAGHRGMAGSAICRALLRAGYTQILTAFRRELDLLDFTAVQRWFAEHQPTVVTLAAARVGGIHANNSYPADFLLDNLKIQANVIETAWRSGVRHLLFLGSSCIYPKFAEQPIREEALLTGSLEPTNEWYAIAKITGIKLCAALRLQHGFYAISLMWTNLFGPGDNYHPTNSHIVASLIRRFPEAAKDGLKVVTCWGSGKALREFLHVDDLADATVFTLGRWKPEEHEVNHLNVGTCRDLSIRRLSELITGSASFKGEIHWDSRKPDVTPIKLLDSTKINKLGCSSKIDAQESMKQIPRQYLAELQSKE